MTEKVSDIITALGTAGAGAVLLKVAGMVLRALRGQRALTVSAAERFQQTLLDEIDAQNRRREVDRQAWDAERRRQDDELEECRRDRADLRGMIGRLEERVAALAERAGVVVVDKIVAASAAQPTPEP